MSDLSAARLRELLHYDPAMGVFTWATARQGIAIGQAAGCIDKSTGYRRIAIDGRDYRAHRLAWLYVHGVWPDGDLDHEDTNKDHNWIDNLRPATQSQNQANTHRHRDNASGLKGVYFYRSRNRWRASISEGDQRKHLGYFDTAEEAHAAYCAAAKKIFGAFARTT